MCQSSMVSNPGRMANVVGSTGPSSTTTARPAPSCPVTTRLIGSITTSPSGPLLARGDPGASVAATGA